MASISAVSVFGRIGSQVAPMDRRARRLRSGLTTTNSTPAALARASHVGQPVDAGAARRDLGVLRGEPAEGDDQAGVLDDRRPVGHPAGHRLVGADHVRQQELRGAPSCSCRPGRRSRRRGTGSAAPGCAHGGGARPTTSRRSRRRSRCRRCRAHARELAGDQSSASSHETSRKRSAPVRGFPSRQPSRIAGRAMRSGECTIAGMALSIGRRRVARERLAADDAAVLDQRREGAPMRERGKTSDGHCSHLPGGPRRATPVPDSTVISRLRPPYDVRRGAFNRAAQNSTSSSSTSSGSALAAFDPFLHRRQRHDGLAIAGAGRVELHVVGEEARADRREHGVGHARLLRRTGYGPP